MSILGLKGLNTINQGAKKVSFTDYSSSVIRIPKKISLAHRAS